MGKTTKCAKIARIGLWIDYTVMIAEFQEKYENRPHRNLRPSKFR